MLDPRTHEIEVSIPLIRRMADNIQDAYKEAENVNKAVGIPTKDWAAFNEHFGGVRDELITITGDTGSGKSTFARCWLHEVAKSETPTLMISLEDTINATIIKFANMIVGKNAVDHDKQDRKQVFNFMSENQMSFLDFNGPIEFDIIEKVIHMAVKEYKVKFIVFDHFDYLLSTKHLRELFGGNEASIRSHMIRKFATMAHNLEVGIAVIVHPAKLGEKGVKRREIGMDEMKGSVSFKQESDTVLSVFRPLKEEDEEDKVIDGASDFGSFEDDKERMYVRAQKIRHGNYAKNMNVMFKFLYDPISGRISEDRFVKKGSELANKEVHYGNLEEWK